MGLALVLVPALASLLAPRAAQVLVPYPGDLRAARTEAFERNAPIVLILMLEGEEASERCRRALLESSELAKACADLPVLLGNNGLHARKKIVEEGEGGPLEREVCALYETPSCTDHQRVFDQAFQAFAENDQLWAPQLLVLAPDATLATRFSNRDVPPLAKVLEAIAQAREKAGPVLDAAALGEVRGRTVLAQRAAQAQDQPGAWQAWRAVLALAPAGPHAEEARAGIERARAALERELAELQARLVPGQAAAAWTRLVELLERCDGLECERALRAALKEAESKRELREELAGAKLEREARAALAEVEEALRAGDERKAERLVRKLLRSKKLAGTETARSARERWPQWSEAGG